MCWVISKVDIVKKLKEYTSINYKDRQKDQNKQKEIERVLHLPDLRLLLSSSCLACTVQKIMKLD